MITLQKIKEGKPVAIINGGKLHGKHVYLVPEEYKHKISRRDDIYETDPGSIINEDEVLALQRKYAKGYTLSPKEFVNLYKNLTRVKPIYIPPKLEMLQKKLKDLYKERRDKFFSLESGSLIPLCEKYSKHNEQVSRFYISGVAGSGKSTLSSKIIKQYKKDNPRHPIYLFSRVDHDDCLDNLGVKRVIIDDSLIDDPLQPSDFEKSLVLFDDCDCLPKKLREAVMLLQNQMLMEGRHNGITVIGLSHVLCNYSQTRNILNESSNICVFPNTGSSHMIKRCMKTYIGLGKPQIDKLLSLPTRWLNIHKSAPIYGMGESWILLL